MGEEVMKVDKKLKEEVMSEAINLFGEPAQVDLCIEECSELFQALVWRRRYNKTIALEDVAEELADVRIMTEQMIKIFDISDKVDLWEDSKIRRQAGRNIGYKQRKSNEAQR